jgi:hypothetical protein
MMFVLIGNNILEIKGMTGSYWIILFSTACFANMLGLNISSGLNSVVAIYVLIPLILVPHLLFSGVTVNFDKLHSSIASEEYVPRIGDIMVSRWAYEALAINQFKDNKFDAVFFEEEQSMSNASYYGTIFIPELLNHVEAARWSLNHGDTDRQKYFQTRLGSALSQLRTEFPRLFPADLADLSSKEIWDTTDFQGIERAFVVARDHFNSQYQYWKQKRDQKMEKLIDKLGGSDSVAALKKDYHNEALFDVVLNKTSIEQFVYTGGKYIRKKDPGYQLPTGKWGRAHFYAPVKNFGSLTISTPIFNVMVMWLGTAILYVTLYFDLLRKLIRYFETFRLRKLHQRLQKLGT